jgi:hypothetical protein
MAEEVDQFPEAPESEAKEVVDGARIEDVAVGRCRMGGGTGAEVLREALEGGRGAGATGSACWWTTPGGHDGLVSSCPCSCSYVMARIVYVPLLQRSTESMLLERAERRKARDEARMLREEGRRVQKASVVVQA